MSESQVVSLRLNDRQIEQIDRLAQHEGRSRSAMVERLLELALRLREFPHLVLRDFGRGPELFLSGSRLRAWWVATLIRAYEGDLAKTAEHINEPVSTIEEVQRYAETYPEAIEEAIAESDRNHEELESWIATRQAHARDLMPADASAP